MGLNATLFATRPRHPDQPLLRRMLCPSTRSHTRTVPLAITRRDPLTVVTERHAAHRARMLHHSSDPFAVLASIDLEVPSLATDRDPRATPG